MIFLRVNISKNFNFFYSKIKTPGHSCEREPGLGIGNFPSLCQLANVDPVYRSYGLATSRGKSLKVTARHIHLDLMRQNPCLMKDCLLVGNTISTNNNKAPLSNQYNTVKRKTNEAPQEVYSWGRFGFTCLNELLGAPCISDRHSFC